MNRMETKVKISAKQIAIVAILAVFAFLPAFNMDYALNVLTRIFLYMAIGQMWNLLAGYTGLASLGQQVFIGLGGYCLAIVSQRHGLPIPVSFVVTVGVTLAVAVIISFPVFKMRGVYFTIGTWIVAEAIAVFFTNWAFVNYAEGFMLTAVYKVSPNTLYLMALALGAGSTALLYRLLRSRLGLALMAIRDNENAAEVRGVKLYKTKLLCFLIASVVTGLAGVVIFMMDPYVKPLNAFGISWAISMVFIVIIGGIGTIEGPIIGAVLYVVLRQWLYGFPGISMVLLGSIAVVVIVALPKGIFGTLHEKYGIEIFSIRRKMNLTEKSTDELY